MQIQHNNTPVQCFPRSQASEIQRYRAVSSATFHNHINGISLGKIQTRNNCTKIFNQKRQLVAIVSLPELSSSGTTTSARYFLCNQTSSNYFAKFLQQLAAGLRENMETSFRALHVAVENLKSALQLRLLSVKQRIPTEINLNKTKSNETPMAARNATGPVWHTLRVTA